ncbi:carbohydrate ABC transporter permease [Halapricum hydrolyticum]|uniref:Carbohydrate ABC transporter permease n=1 Tax=Halapricum hydrolyticum TaxID=2979991 RepID=A0AAE3LF03_9EURY|nr:carbohydrate ABC transporter permease [Halapricum hydrolyticum]MCU4717872.1 carbohydrate ABC transporter permease [Halapricum hydrolyticum]MCU4727037.1 carbohydrate ABC transporter permease [Halapricum hydrolyticum]
MSQTTTSDRDGIASLLPEFNYRRLGLYLVIMLFVAFFVSPIWTGLVTSFKPPGQATQPLLPPGPELFTLDSWSRALDNLGRGFVNSFAMAVPATLVNVLLASTAAYGLTLVDWRRQMLVVLLFVFGIFIPYQAILVPLDNFWTNIFPLAKGLAIGNVTVIPANQRWGTLAELAITHVAYGIPICFLLFRSYYKTISKELIEAAKVDGASVTRIYTRIVLPLSTPMIGVVLIYQFTQIWNEFLFSLTLIGSSADQAATITLILSGIGADLSGTNFPLRMAAAFLAALPTIIIYVLFAEQFAEGLSAG